MRDCGITPSDVTGVRPPIRGRGRIYVVMFAETPKRCLVLTASPGYRLNGRTLGCDAPSGCRRKHQQTLLSTKLEELPDTFFVLPYKINNKRKPGIPDYQVSTKAIIKYQVNYMYLKLTTIFLVSPYKIKTMDTYTYIPDRRS